MRIRTRLILAITLTTLTVLGASALFLQAQFERGLLDHANQRVRQSLEATVPILARHYVEQSGWHQLAERPQRLGRLLLEEGVTAERRREPGANDGEAFEPPPRRIPPRALILLDADRQPILGPAHREAEYEPIRVGQRIVGWLGVPVQRQLVDQLDLVFQQSQRRAFLWVGFAGVLLTLGVAWILARTLTRPIEALTRATEALRQGNHGVRLDETRRDELGQLARDFNRLAHTLASHEASRRQWVADISHELRTPLAILRGEIEAMLDGVRPIDRSGLLSIQEEMLHLGKLVDDLHLLSQAEIGGLRYQMQGLELGDLLRAGEPRWRDRLAERHMTLQMKSPERRIQVEGDTTRLLQVLDNLVDNAAKYGRDQGALQIRAWQEGDRAVLLLEDDGPGVPAEALPHLFEHLYRVESSRNRQAGGSGLGLAICKRIIEAHRGTILALPSERGGLQIRLTLPLWSDRETA